MRKVTKRTRKKVAKAPEVQAIPPETTETPGISHEEKKTKKLNLWIDVEVWKRLAHAHIDQGETMTAIVERALRVELKL
jgi:hypothetical protein